MTDQPKPNPSQQRQPAPAHELPRRKSSRTRKSLALGTIAATGLTVAACEDNSSQARLFGSIADCNRAGFSELVCEREYDDARQRHAQNAPKFKTEPECEEQFGQNRCAPTTQPAGNTTQTVFAPLLTGFLVSQALYGVRSSRAYYTYRTGFPDYYSQPVYRDRRGRDVTTARQGSGSAARTVTRPVNVNTRTVARRGFGGRSSSRGWGG